MNHRLLHVRFSAAILTLGLALLTGCHRQFTDPNKLQSTADSHSTTFNFGETQTFNNNRGMTLSSGGAAAEVDVYIDESGHSLPKSYYIVYCDIYWRLNWIRQELKKGNVPEQFTRKLANVRKELKEATAGIAHDGNYKVADEALTFLESGWEHYQSAEDLVAAGAQTSSAPWSVGTLAMQQYIESGGFGFGGKSLANAPISPVGSATAPGTAESGVLNNGVTQDLTPKQERAIAVAVKYAGEFHRAPRDCAREDWSRAVEKINKLRDQLWMMNKANNKDSSNVVDVRPNTGSDTSTNDIEHGTNSYIKNGTDLPTASAPTGDPFRMPPPAATSSPSNKTRHEDEQP